MSISRARASSSWRRACSRSSSARSEGDIDGVCSGNTTVPSGGFAVSGALTAGLGGASSFFATNRSGDVGGVGPAARKIETFLRPRNAWSIWAGSRTHSRPVDHQARDLQHRKAEDRDQDDRG